MAAYFSVPYDSGLGSSLVVCVRKLGGQRYDFADGTFKSSPTTPRLALTEGTGDYAGIYTGTVASTPSASWDGVVEFTYHDVRGSGSNWIDQQFWQFVEGVQLLAVAGSGGGGGTDITLDNGAVIASPAPAVGGFSASGATLNPRTGAYDGMHVRFTSGDLEGERRPIWRHVYSGGVHGFAFRTSSQWSQAPAAGDTFRIE